MDLSIARLVGSKRENWCLGRAQSQRRGQTGNSFLNPCMLWLWWEVVPLTLKFTKRVSSSVSKSFLFMGADGIVMIIHYQRLSYPWLINMGASILFPEHSRTLLLNGKQWGIFIQGCHRHTSPIPNESNSMKIHNARWSCSLHSPVQSSVSLFWVADIDEV